MEASSRKAVAFDIERQEAPSAATLQPARSILKRGSEQSGDDHGGGDPQTSDANLPGDEEAAAAAYDPYLGLGARTAPDLPVLLVFNLMESQRFGKFSSPLRTRLFYVAAAAGGALLVASLLLCVVLLGFQVREHPQLPRVRVNALSIVNAKLMNLKPGVLLRQQEEGKGNYFAYRLNYNCEVLMTVTNPNRHLDIHHNYIEVTTFYHGWALAIDRIDNIPHPRGTVIRPVFRTIAIGLPIPLHVGYTLAKDLNNPFSTATEMVAEIILNSRISLLGRLKPLPFVWRCRCVVNDLGAYSKGFECNCLDAKWRPRENLKHYRMVSWPRDYSEVLENPRFELSDDYYDPSINYLAENLTRWDPYVPYLPPYP